MPGEDKYLPTSRIHGLDPGNSFLASISTRRPLNIFFSSWVLQGTYSQRLLVQKGYIYKSVYPQETELTTSSIIAVDTISLSKEQTKKRYQRLPKLCFFYIFIWEKYIFSLFFNLQSNFNFSPLKFNRKNSIDSIAEVELNTAPPPRSLRIPLPK
ncbi:hypothetical protein EYR41_011782 [Orbilia oligospora]|uniref:Uncharacterized protein n=1 Tax=Orbilia oligospora TaxID=2813651 RepID=A0A7C8KK19_ORBOL|nr:hypothetical protein TWF751_003074 [Orbilia oligospora]TGJ62593.1 hypothetical protein EYR41_011782 [Orbilia oligospora]